MVSAVVSCPATVRVAIWSRSCVLVNPTPVSGSRAVTSTSNRSRGGSCGGVRERSSIIRSSTRLKSRASQRRAASSGLGAAAGSRKSRKDGRASSCAVALEGGAHGRPVLAHPLREERPPGDLERQPLDDAQQVDGTGAAGGELGHRLLGDLGDVGRRDVQAARREGGCGGPPLVLPGRTLRQEQPVAEDRAQDADAGRGAAVIGVVVDQHPLDAVGVADQEAGPPHERARDDVELVGRLAPGRDRVALQLQDRPPQRQHLGRGPGCRGHDGLARQRRRQVRPRSGRLRGQRARRDGWGHHRILSRRPGRLLTGWPRTT